MDTHGDNRLLHTDTRSPTGSIARARAAIIFSLATKISPADSLDPITWRLNLGDDNSLQRHIHENSSALFGQLVDFLFH